MYIFFQPPYKSFKYMNPFTMIPMPPGHTEDLGRTRYLLAWLIEALSRDLIALFDDRVKAVFSQRGII